jgi:hypothetical protein
VVIDGSSNVAGESPRPWRFAGKIIHGRFSIAMFTGGYLYTHGVKKRPA